LGENERRKPLRNRLLKFQPLLTGRQEWGLTLIKKTLALEQSIAQWVARLQPAFNSNP
jgi:hypothetical protein